jgi:hypothetical protein
MDKVHKSYSNQSHLRLGILAIYNGLILGFLPGIIGGLEKIFE